jgi:hypothetical protein
VAAALLAAVLLAQRAVTMLRHQPQSGPISAKADVGSSL